MIEWFFPDCIFWKTQLVTFRAKKHSIKPTSRFLLEFEPKFHETSTVSQHFKTLIWFLISWTPLKATLVWMNWDNNNNAISFDFPCRQSLKIPKENLCLAVVTKVRVQFTHFPVFFNVFHSDYWNSEIRLEVMLQSFFRGKDDTIGRVFRTIWVMFSISSTMALR